VGPGGVGSALGGAAASQALRGSAEIQPLSEHFLAIGADPIRCQPHGAAHPTRETSRNVAHHDIGEDET
jgi:hypothetical protein